MKFFTNSGVTMSSARMISDASGPSAIAFLGTAATAGAAETS